VDQFIVELRNLFASRPEAYSLDADELAVYGRDLYSYHSGPGPNVVVFPRDTADVSAVVKLCGKYRIPVVARGSGTSLEGHATTPLRGCCVDLHRMDALLQLRPADLDATVQPGISWQELNRHLAPHRLFFPVDPGPGASIGGMCATNASGTNATRYGPMKNNVLNVTAVMADGSVIRTGTRARKTSAGYDLTSLLLGSEGTLAIVTEVTVRLSHVPPKTAVAGCNFPSIRAASACTLALMQSGVQVGAVELLDAPMIDAVNVQSGFQYPVRPHLFFKLSGSEAKVADDAELLKSLVAAHGGADFEWTQDEAGQHRLWEARKVALWSAAAMDTAKKIATTDVCVPLSRMPDLMAAMEEESRRSPLRVYAVGHVGDGNAHHFIAFDPLEPGELREAKRLNSFLVKKAIEMGGTSTGEHGIGAGKRDYLPLEYGPEAVAVMQAIKRALDPLAILNPGKKLPDACPVSFPAAPQDSDGPLVLADPSKGCCGSHSHLA
jgi:D-lactate dehydrogenase (cytochrome)